MQNFALVYHNLRPANNCAVYQIFPIDISINASCETVRDNAILPSASAFCAKFKEDSR